MLYSFLPLLLTWKPAFECLKTGCQDQVLDLILVYPYPSLRVDSERIAKGLCDGVAARAVDPWFYPWGWGIVIHSLSLRGLEGEKEREMHARGLLRLNFFDCNKGFLRHIARKPPTVTLSIFFSNPLPVDARMLQLAAEL